VCVCVCVCFLFVFFPARTAAGLIHGVHVVIIIGLCSRRRKKDTTHSFSFRYIEEVRAIMFRALTTLVSGVR